jgi:predicted ATP-dependent protease
VIIPKLNEKDLWDVPDEVKRKLKFTLAETVDDVLAVALLRKGGGGRKPKPAGPRKHEAPKEEDDIKERPDVARSIAIAGLSLPTVG